MLAVDAPDGTRDAVVVHQDDSARAVLVVLNAGQALGQHQVKENAWISVVDGSVQVAAGETTVELAAAACSGSSRRSAMRCRRPTAPGS